MLLCIEQTSKWIRTVQSDDSQSDSEAPTFDINYNPCKPSSSLPKECDDTGLLMLEDEGKSCAHIAIAVASYYFLTSYNQYN